MKKAMLVTFLAMSSAFITAAAATTVEDFGSLTPGIKGGGKNGEKITDRISIVYYVPGKGWGERLCARIIEENGKKQLMLEDKVSQNGIYANIALNGRSGEISFQLKLPEVRQFYITMNAYQVVLGILDRDLWNQYFADKPYRKSLVYLEGTGEKGFSAKTQNAVKAVDTGFIPEAGKFHKMSFKWDDSTKKVTVSADGRKIVDNLRYTSSIFDFTECLRIHTTSYKSPRAFSSNCSFVIDEVTITK